MVTHAKSIKYAHKKPNCRTCEPRIHFSVFKFLCLCLTKNLCEKDSAWRELLRNNTRQPKLSVIHYKFAKFLPNALLLQTVFKCCRSFSIVYVKTLLKLRLVFNLIYSTHSLHGFKYWSWYLSFVIFLFPYETWIKYSWNFVVIVALKVKNDFVLGFIAQVRWPAA